MKKVKELITPKLTRRKETTDMRGQQFLRTLTLIMVVMAAILISTLPVEAATKVSVPVPVAEEGKGGNKYQTIYKIKGTVQMYGTNEVINVSTYCKIWGYIGGNEVSLVGNHDSTWNPEDGWFFGSKGAFGGLNSKEKMLVYDYYNVKDDEALYEYIRENNSTDGQGWAPLTLSNGKVEDATLFLVKLYDDGTMQASIIAKGQTGLFAGTAEKTKFIPKVEVEEEKGSTGGNTNNNEPSKDNPNNPPIDKPNDSDNQGGMGSGDKTEKPGGGTGGSTEGDKDLAGGGGMEEGGSSAGNGSTGNGGSRPGMSTGM